jgi:predicted nucleic acid-binding protein
MSVLVDTNVLLRRTQPRHKEHWAAVESVAHFLAAGESVYFTHQNIAEFWNVATRSVSNNGLALTHDLVLREVETIERILTLLPDSPAMYTEWKRLVSTHKVSGVQVHDARLVAAMNVHGVRQLLTFDVEDFARYDIDVLHPTTVLL